MYCEHFGLEEMPFSIAPDPRYLYLSEQHREALAHLIYGINSEGGFVLLTGDVGTGKTTVCRCLLDQLTWDTETAFIFNPKLTAMELLATICDEFGILYPEGNTSIKVFIDLINAYVLNAHAKGHSTVLIIDEAQNLSPGVLEQLRLLTNLETSRHKLLQIILLGQPELKRKLSKPGLKQLSQRITARYHLGPLSKKDVAAYVTHRLSVAGLKKQVFPPSAIGKLYRLSGGVPRLINILCDRALLGAFVKGHNQVLKATLKKAADEAFGNVNAVDRHKRVFQWLPAILFIIITGVVFIPSYNNNQESRLVETHVIKPVKPDTLTWPDAQQKELSKVMAFQALFKQWGVPYVPGKDSTACEYARGHGLQCLPATGNLGSLRRINMPAVLELFDNQGQTYYATLISLSKETSTFVIGTETRVVDVKDLESKWSGSYILMLRIPIGNAGVILPGTAGPAVQWLDKQLAILEGREAKTGGNLVFDNTMIVEVKKFQLARGLLPDGIVGPQTIIHLNTVTGSGVPLLTRVLTPASLTKGE